MRIPIRLATVLVAGLVLALAPAAAAPRYVLDAQPGPAAPAGRWIYGIAGFNDAQQILTTSFPVDPGPMSVHLYTPGAGLQPLHPDDGRLHEAWDLNERGEAAGLSDLAAYVFRAGGAGSPVPGVAPTSSYAYAINDRGMVVGHLDVAGPYWHVPGEGTHVVDLPLARAAVDVNDRDVVLVSGDAPGMPFWLHDTRDGATTRLDFDRRFGPRAWLNDAGDIAFQEVGPFGLEARVALWRDGVLTDIAGLAGATYDRLLDLNDGGLLLGDSYFGGDDELGPRRGFLHVPGEGTFAVAALVDPASLAGWTDLHPFKLNDAGDIAGWGVFEGRDRLFVLQAVATPVPEPGAALLLALGVGGVAGVARAARRRQPSAAAC